MAAKVTLCARGSLECFLNVTKGVWKHQAEGRPSHQQAQQFQDLLRCTDAVVQVGGLALVCVNEHIYSCGFNMEALMVSVAVVLLSLQECDWGILAGDHVILFGWSRM